ncbi:FxsA family protein [Euzebya sp.]|uniref:FxsA family protein n=1 Tax=Euzebya sp. TaxID=1971409 RepID=UPI0035186F83
MLPFILLAFVVVPIVEITAIGQVQAWLGWPTTILILVLDSVVGAYLVRMQGALAWRNFQAAVAEGRLPTEEVADGALILFGGALMLTPGFVTDAVGLICVFTPTRKLLNGWVRRRVQLGGGPFGQILTIGSTPRARGSGRRGWRATGSDEADARPPRRGGPPTSPPPRRDPGVIDIEVVEVRRNDDARRPERPSDGDAGG